MCADTQLKWYKEGAIELFLELGNRRPRSQVITVKIPVR